MNINSSYQRVYPIMDMPVPYMNPLPAVPLADASTSQNLSEIDVQVSNVVCSYSLPLHIDLKLVAMNTGNVEFIRGRGWLLKQKRNPACLVKVFSNGKVCIIGCRSEAECKTAARQVARLIQRSMNKLNEVVRIRNYQVNNIFATCKMPFGIKIEEIAQQYPKTNYEPELSVGLIWKNEDPKATLRIHTTGSVTITGATSEESVVTVIKNIYPILKKFSCSSRGGNDNMNRLQQINKVYRKRTFQTPKSYNCGNPSVDLYSAKRVCNNAGNSISSSSYGSSSSVPSSSGMYGDKMYFSDEEELYEDFRMDIDEVE